LALKIEFKLIFSEASKRDLKQIHDYIVLNFFSEISARHKVDLLLKGSEILQDIPELGFDVYQKTGKKFLGLDHIRILVIENYLVVYQIDFEKNGVNIFRFLNVKTDYLRYLR
jgi:addiction module RelE/StbE family toxin